MIAMLFLCTGGFGLFKIVMGFNAFFFFFLSPGIPLFYIWWLNYTYCFREQVGGHVFSSVSLRKYHLSKPLEFLLYYF